MTIVMRCHALAILACAAGLTGCAKSPEQEGPIPIRPGLYQADLSGSVASFMVSTGAGPGKALSRTLCLSGSDSDNIQNLVSLGLLDSSKCQTNHGSRIGNAISAGSVCPVEPGKGSGSASLSFSGVTTPEGLTGAYQFHLDIAPNGKDIDPQTLAAAKVMTGLIKIEARFKRIGDCNGAIGGSSNPWGN